MDWATKEGFFKCPVPKERITVPDLGDIWVYGLTVQEKDEWESEGFRFTGKSYQMRLANARASLLRRTVRNQHGVLLFGEKDMGRLCQVPAAIAEPILTVARRLSAMATGEIEDLVKNSETARKADETGCDSELPKPGAGPQEKSPGG